MQNRHTDNHPPLKRHPQAARVFEAVPRKKNNGRQESFRKRDKFPTTRMRKMPFRFAMYLIFTTFAKESNNTHSGDLTMEWQQLISNKRFGKEESHDTMKDDRTVFQRDYDRLIFSAAFRRLQNKTQVFPLPNQIFVHNRLTHSLEVASVGRSLGHDSAAILIKRHPELKKTHLTEAGGIVSAACLAHDMGNPPFGHSGEKAINSYFSEGEGLRFKDMLDDEQEWDDFTRFEGNANAFRLLTHQFRGRRKGGFVMTYTTLASVVKYPWSSVSDAAEKKHKLGFFKNDEPAYLRIAEELGIKRLSRENEPARYARHPLVFLVEAADDICYAIMDIEDAHKLKLLTTAETKELLFSFLEPELQKKIESGFSVVTDENEEIVYLRSVVINCLTQECIRTFVDNETAILDGSFEGSLIRHIAPMPRAAYEACMQAAREKIYRSKEVVDIELAGFKVILSLAETFIEAVTHPHKTYSKLLMERIAPQYETSAPTLYGKILAVLDFLSSTTDVYALDLYRRINGISIPNV